MPGTLVGGGGGPSTPTTQQGFVRTRGGAAPSTEEGAYLQGFTPARAHLLLREVYGYFLHHNYGTHLTGVVPDDAIWKSRLRRQAVQSDS